MDLRCRLALTALLLFAPLSTVVAEESRALGFARSTAYVFASDPAVALEGGQLSVAWAGTQRDGRWRILLSRQGGLPEVVDSTPSGENRNPVVAFDAAAGDTGVAWLHREGGRQALLLREFDNTGTAGAVEVVTATATGMLESPALVYLGAGMPALAWTEVEGSESAVWVARRIGGEWHRQRVSSERFPFEMLPQFLDRVAPRVWYFAWDGGDLSLRSCEVAAWGLSAPKQHPDFPVPAGRIPMLYESGKPDRPGALWLEAMERSDALMAWEPATSRDGSAALLATVTGRETLDPAVSPDGSVAWLSGPRSDRAVIVRPPVGDEFTVRTTASARQLRVAVGERVSVIVWINEPSDGGDGRLEAVVVQQSSDPIAERASDR